MTIQTVRRLAAEILDVGENKIRISPDGLKDAEGALTRSDVKGLIEKGIVSRVKSKGRASTKKMGRRGHGHRRGAVISGKDAWMMKVRSQRKFLRQLISTGALKPESKRAVYDKVKSVIFRNKKAMLVYLKENKLVAEDHEPKKAEYRPRPSRGRPTGNRPAKKAEPKKAEAKPAPEAKKPEQKRHEAPKKEEQHKHPHEKGESR